MKALQDLENAASGDAAVRQKIASLPQEVQDVSLLEKITGEGKKRLRVYVLICLCLEGHLEVVDEEFPFCKRVLDA